MPERLTTAILGAGRIAGGYDRSKVAGDEGVYTHAGAFRRDGRFALETVYDLDPARAARFADEWGVARVAGSVEEVLRGHHDVVSVCTPDDTHAELVTALCRQRACRTLFVEKPLARTAEEIRRLVALASGAGVQLVVDFQRRFDPVHAEVRELIARGDPELRGATAWYVKGLEHIGVTLVDTLVFLLGRPRRVLAYERVLDPAVGEPSYEFVLWFDRCNVTCKTVDRPSGYAYHLFEIDLLFADRRLTLDDNSRTLATRRVGGYAYAGVKALDDARVERRPTGYATSLVRAADYLHGITARGLPHDVNTGAASLESRRVLDAVATSYQRGLAVELGSDP